MARKSAAPLARTRWYGKRPGLFVNNIRFYILVLAAASSLLIISYLRTTVSSDTLFMIRVQQVYGFAALFAWYIALLATPLSTIFGKEGLMKHYLFSRRALGVSAAYFATLHMLFGLFGQLGGFGNILLLPARFQVALLFGLITLLVLWAMAFTSFDKVIKWMTFPRWKWLHRVGYIAAILVFLHVWMIGTHLSYSWLRWTFFCGLVLFAGLESFRAATLLRRKLGGVGTAAFLVFFITFFAWSVAFITYLPRWVDSYHQSHGPVGGH